MKKATGKENDVLTKTNTIIHATLRGLSGIMFCRFIDHSKQDRPVEQKLYFDADGKTLVIPSTFLESFLARQLAPVGCCCKFEGRKGKEYASIVLSHVFFAPELIPITETKTGGSVQLETTIDKDPRFYIASFSGITKMSGGGAIKQEAAPRPVLRHGWEISFDINLIKNTLIDETKLFNWFSAGGIFIGLGSYRPRYGRFEIAKWDIEEK